MQRAVEILRWIDGRSKLANEFGFTDVKSLTEKFAGERDRKTWQDVADFRFREYVGMEESDQK